MKNIKIINNTQLKKIQAGGVGSLILSGLAYLGQQAWEHSDQIIDGYRQTRNK
ncbi:MULTISPECIES: bacteriocin [Aerococcus]|uniref:Bacteriocin n=1 Tax=Aerococcus sanguinicola TaxID=119206 RepID=A0A5N1GJP7_9LACT|nr:MULTISPECIES: bacteriocin [Aerococcus]KAA9301203.1 bacteriocin [Aerococcus sanguinicola]MDK6369264.1 bacteriocin [Aerococcus sp. UMB9870]MDK6679088.1 bacteriocin [Aerococcus sp. UMB8608]MDK6686995.1 bacteriocin [Aerococcus sp. UMB8623]MDK6940151.1 bacteriocin [Aerococcus sp. UMB8487]